MPGNGSTRNWKHQGLLLAFSVITNLCKMEWLKAANTSTISRSGQTDIQKSQTNLMFLGNPHSRQGRVEVLIKLNAAQKGRKVVWGQSIESEVCVLVKTCSAVEWGGWKWCRGFLARKDLRSCTGRARCSVHCTAQLGGRLGFKRKYVSYLPKTARAAGWPLTEGRV